MISPEKISESKLKISIPTFIAKSIAAGEGE
jgi:hypothetical protein